MAACSFLLPNLIPSTRKTLALTPTYSPAVTHSLSLSQSSGLPLTRRTRKRSELSTVAKVAVSPEYDQEDASFSADLKLFVGNLPFTVDSSELAALFESAGSVEMVEVIYDKTTGRSRGFGFVTMSTVEEVEAAVEQFNGYEFQGRELKVNSGPPPARREENPSRGFRSRGVGGSYEEVPSRGFRSGAGGGFRSERGGGFRSGGGGGFRSEGGGGFRSGGGGGSFDAANRLFVGNLSWGVDDLALETLFSEQGKVMNARVVYDRETGRSRGFGFVTLSSAEEVDNAISSLDGCDLDGRSIRVSAAEAKPPRLEF